LTDSKLPGNLQRIALWVEYDGSGFNGWQLQKGSSARSVQAELEAAVSYVANQPVRLHCAGRTDTGVHATNQLVHFDSPNTRPQHSWLRGCNGRLPPDVSIRHAQEVPQDFHARFSALSRRYRYLIYNNAVRPAIGARYLSWVRAPLDAQQMHRAAQALLGEQDFTSFRAAACQSSTPMRRVDSVRVERRGDLVIVDIQANAFLHHMVRNIVGTLIAVGRGQRAEGWVAELLALRDRTRAADTAAAAGLYLVAVEYPVVYELPVLSAGPVLLGEHSSL